MRKIFISAGHSNTAGRDRGAAGNGYIEGDLTVDLRNRLVIELKKLGIEPVVDGNNTILADTLAKFKNLTTKDAIVLDLHWNAAGPTATGTEVLIPGESSEFEKNLARSLAQAVNDVLGIPMRGNKGVKTELESHHGRLGWMRLNGENVLLEVCFISNKEEMKKYDSNRDKLAKRLAEVLKDYVTFGAELARIPNTYTVISGDSLSKISKKYNISVDELKNKNGLKTDLIKVGQILKV